MNGTFTTDCTQWLNVLLFVGILVEVFAVLSNMRFISTPEMLIKWRDGKLGDRLEIVARVITFLLGIVLAMCLLCFNTGMINPIEGIDYGQGAESPIEQICDNK